MKNRMKIIFFIIIFLFTGIIYGALKKIKAPDFSLFDLNNKIVRLSKFKNKIIILNFFATWCPPCRMEIPGLIEFYKEYKSRGVVLLGICLDAKNIKKVRKFAKSYKINYPVLIGTRKVVMDYGGIRAIPTTFFINHNGEIVDRIIGYADEEELKAIVDKLIKIRDAQIKKRKRFQK